MFREIVLGVGSFHQLLRSRDLLRFPRRDGVVYAEAIHP
jgi:hypothetical protein